MASVKGGVAGAAVIGVLLAGLVPQAAQSGPEAPMPVLSDTPEYCALLEAKIAAQPSRPADVKRLVHDGHLLCDHGQVREGIARLRRALVMLKHKTPALIMP